MELFIFHYLSRSPLLLVKGFKNCPHQVGDHFFVMRLSDVTSKQKERRKGIVQLHGGNGA